MAGHRLTSVLCVSLSVQSQAATDFVFDCLEEQHAQHAHKGADRPDLCTLLIAVQEARAAEQQTSRALLSLS